MLDVYADLFDADSDAWVRPSILAARPVVQMCPAADRPEKVEARDQFTP